jgi:hypothetical protein
VSKCGRPENYFYLRKRFVSVPMIRTVAQTVQLALLLHSLNARRRVDNRFGANSCNDRMNEIRKLDSLRYGFRQIYLRDRTIFHFDIAFFICNWERSTQAMTNEKGDMENGK